MTAKADLRLALARIEALEARVAELEQHPAVSIPALPHTWQPQLDPPPPDWQGNRG